MRSATACGSTGTSPIEMDDGLVLRADVFRPDERRPVPGDPDLRPVRQGPAVPGGLSERVGADGREAPGRRRRLDEQVPELGGRRSGEVGAGRLRLRARRLARRRPLAGLHRPLLAARDAGLPRLHRVGGRAAVVERQGRPERHLLLRRSTSGRSPALQPPHLAAMCVWEGAADWYRDSTHHGGILSTFWANWYDMQVKTVQYGLGERGPRTRNTGELVCGDETLTDEELAAQPRRLRRRVLDAPARRRLLPRALGRLGRGSRCRCSPPATGAARGCTCAATSRASCAPARSRSGSRCTASSTGRTSTPTTASRCRSASSATSSRARTTAGTTQPPRAAAGPPRRRRFASAPRRSGRSRARGGREFYLDPRNGRSIATELARPTRRVRFEALGDGLTFTHRAARAARPRSPGPSAQALRLLRRRPTPTSSPSSASSTPDGQEVIFQGAIDPHTPIAQGWLRASHRKLDPELSEPYRPFHTHDEQQPLSRASRSSSTSRSGRPASSCPPATASR